MEAPRRVTFMTPLLGAYQQQQRGENKLLKPCLHSANMDEKRVALPYKTQDHLSIPSCALAKCSELIRASEPQFTRCVTTKSALRDIVGPTKLPDTLQAMGEEDFEKGITKSNLVFGGSFPIDAPISARQLGTPASQMARKTFQVDAVCCAPPNLCEDHSPYRFTSVVQSRIVSNVVKSSLQLDAPYSISSEVERSTAVRDRAEQQKMLNISSSYNELEGDSLSNSEGEELEEDVVDGCYGYHDEEAYGHSDDDYYNDDDDDFSFDENDEDDQAEPDFEAGLNIGTPEGVHAHSPPLPPPSSSSRSHFPSPKSSSLPHIPSSSTQGPALCGRQEAPLHDYSNTAFCPQPQSPPGADSGRRPGPTLGTNDHAVSQPHASSPFNRNNKVESKVSDRTFGA